MHILLVDDEPLAREELAYLVGQHPAVTSIAEAESVEEALEEMLDHKPDILFLDIHLTDESGFDLAEKLVPLKKKPYLIFATAYDQYALKAFEVNAQDYVLKPFEEAKIQAVIDKALKSLQPKEESAVGAANHEKFETIPIQGEDRIYMLAPEDIILVSVEERNVSIYTEKQVYTSVGTLSKFEEKLPPEFFIKTHRSFLINRTKIQEIQAWFNHTLQLVMINGSRVPVSRSYLKEFKQKMGI